MKIKLKFISYFILLFSTIIFFTSCSKLENISSVTTQATFRNLSESSKPGTFQMSYEGFDGSVIKTFNVNKGDKITFNYDSTVKEGVLTMAINDPFGTVLSNLPVSKKGSLKIVSKGIGKISMVVTGKNTTGSLKILWK